MFSLLQEIIVPQFGQFVLFPLSVAVSKDFLSPNAIGDLNAFLQFGHTTSVSGMADTSRFILNEFELLIKNPHHNLADMRNPPMHIDSIGSFVV